MSSLKSIRYSLTPQMREYDKLGHIWRPYVMFTQQQNFRSPIVNTDNFGLRLSNSGKDDETPFSLFLKPKNEKEEIAVIGGSVAFGTGSSSDNFSISSLLSRASKKNVYNLGGRAFSGFQELLIFQMLLNKFSKLKYIVIVSGGNDIFLSHYIKKSDKDFGPFFYQKQFYENMNRPFDSIYRKFLFNILPSRKKKSINWLWDDRMMIIKKFFVFNKNEDRSVMVNQFDYHSLISNNLNLWRLLSNSMNCKVIYALQPVATWCDHEFSAQEKKIFESLGRDTSQIASDALRNLTKEKYINYTKFIKNECEKCNFIYIDLNKEFSNKDLNRKWLFVDTTHCTDLGYSIIADKLYSYLQ